MNMLLTSLCTSIHSGADLGVCACKAPSGFCGRALRARLCERRTYLNEMDRSDGKWFWILIFYIFCVSRDGASGVVFLSRGPAQGPMPL